LSRKHNGNSLRQRREEAQGLLLAAQIAYRLLPWSGGDSP
jgi:hypothetical protein